VAGGSGNLMEETVLAWGVPSLTGEAQHHPPVCLLPKDPRRLQDGGVPKMNLPNDISSFRNQGQDALGRWEGASAADF
jgi:hypothetical protein